MIVASVGNVLVWAVWLGAAFACLGSAVAVVSFANPFFSALTVTLFFSGWHGPWAPLGPLWFLLKLFVCVSVFIWLKATLPRLRYDQLMRFGWKILLPVATVNAVVTAAVVVWVG